jgi:hypothetical protein
VEGIGVEYESREGDKGTKGISEWNKEGEEFRCERIPQ